MHGEPDYTPKPIMCPIAAQLLCSARNFEKMYLKDEYGLRKLPRDPRRIPGGIGIKLVMRTKIF